MRFTLGFAALAIAAALATGAAAAPDKPTIVLVHGAFADSSSWNGVIADLQRDGYTVVAAGNPLGGLRSDAELGAKCPAIPLGAALTSVPLPDGGMDLYVRPDQFGVVFAPDVPPEA